MKIIIIGFFMFLYACSIKNYYGELSPGDFIYVNQALVIKENDARVSIQNGKVEDYARLDHFYPHCWFVSLKRNASSQVIQSDTFKIIEIQYRYDIVHKQNIGYRLSALMLNGGAPVVNYTTEIIIGSDRQKDITRLLCSHLEDPADAEHLTIAQIKQTLGSLVSFSLKAKQQSRLK